VVEEHDARAPAPGRAEEGHAVPDLDQQVAGTGAAGHLRERGSGEHHVAAGPADHLVAVAHGLGRLALGPRGAQRDLDAGCRPALRDLCDVDLGPAGLDVVEVAPGQGVHTADAGGGCQVADLLDCLSALVEGGRRHR
jgi:hypothetical protein